MQAPSGVTPVRGIWKHRYDRGRRDDVFPAGSGTRATRQALVHRPVRWATGARIIVSGDKVTGVAPETLPRSAPPSCPATWPTTAFALRPGPDQIQFQRLCQRLPRWTWQKASLPPIPRSQDPVRRSVRPVWARHKCRWLGRRPRLRAISAKPLRSAPANLPIAPSATLRSGWRRAPAGDKSFPVGGSKRTSPPAVNATRTPPSGAAAGRRRPGCCGRGDGAGPVRSAASGLRCPST